MEQPEGFNDGSGRVCRLKLPLYGLKQAGRMWNKKLNAQLTTLGFNRTNADPCVYYNNQDGKITILTVWVDDIILCGDSESRIDTTVSALKKIFEVKDLGEPKLLLGIQIIRNRKLKTITISQRNYINTILERFNYSKINPIPIPLDPNVTLRKRDDEITPPEKHLVKEYQTKLGSIMYASIGTMPQLAYAVQTLSQFSSNPGAEHMSALKRVFKYLAHARDHEVGIVYGGTRQWPVDIIGYTDADWASNPNDRKSISGYVFLLGGGAISWSSKKQTTVALSSTEAEYMAATHAARHAIWLQRLFQDIGIQLPDSMALFIDNQSTISISNDVMFHQRTKHIDIQYHFIRNLVIDGIIDTYYCPTLDMVADILTKGLPRAQHEKLTVDMGVLPA